MQTTLWEKEKWEHAWQFRGLGRKRRKKRLKYGL